MLYSFVQRNGLAGEAIGSESFYEEPGHLRIVDGDDTTDVDVTDWTTDQMDSFNRVTFHQALDSASQKLVDDANHRIDSMNELLRW